MVLVNRKNHPRRRGRWLLPTVIMAAVMLISFVFVLRMSWASTTIMTMSSMMSTQQKATTPHDDATSLLLSNHRLNCASSSSRSRSIADFLDHLGATLRDESTLIVNAPHATTTTTTTTATTTGATNTTTTLADARLSKHLSIYYRLRIYAALAGFAFEWNHPDHEESEQDPTTTTWMRHLPQKVPAVVGEDKLRVGAEELMQQVFCGKSGAGFLDHLFWKDSPWANAWSNLISLEIRQALLTYLTSPGSLSTSSSTSSSSALHKVYQQVVNQMKTNDWLIHEDCRFKANHPHLALGSYRMYNALLPTRTAEDDSNDASFTIYTRSMMDNPYQDNFCRPLHVQRNAYLTSSLTSTNSKQLVLRMQSFEFEKGSHFLADFIAMVFAPNVLIATAKILAPKSLFSSNAADAAAREDNDSGTEDDDDNDDYRKWAALAHFGSGGKLAMLVPSFSKSGTLQLSWQLWKVQKKNHQGNDSTKQAEMILDSIPLCLPSLDYYHQKMASSSNDLGGMISVDLQARLSVDLQAKLVKSMIECFWEWQMGLGDDRDAKTLAMMGPMPGTLAVPVPKADSLANLAGQLQGHQQPLLPTRQSTLSSSELTILPAPPSVHVCNRNPYLAALNESTDELEWIHRKMDEWLVSPSSLTNSSFQHDYWYTEHHAENWMSGHERFAFLKPQASCQPNQLECFGGGCGMDESKYVCGFKSSLLEQSSTSLSSRCIIYSVGGNNQWGFEKSLLETTSCEIHTFDCTGPKSRFRKPTSNRIHFHHVCLGVQHETAPLECTKGVAKCGETWTLQEMQQNLQHERIDLLKVDIEGFEWQLFASWPTLISMSPSVASNAMTNPPPTMVLPYQIVVEFHYKTIFADVHMVTDVGSWGQVGSFASPANFVQLKAHFLRLGYLIIFRDNNKFCPHCTELTLIRTRCPLLPPIGAGGAA